MASVISICNTALSNIGKDTISALDEASEQARQCSLHYDIAVENLLQQYPWKFATVVSSFAQLDSDLTAWQYKYQPPSNVLKVIRVFPEVDYPYEFSPIKFASLGGFIYCDISPAYGEYIDGNVNISKFTPMFADAVSWALASRICYTLTKDAGLRKATYQLALNAAEAAAVNDANMQPESWEWPSEFIEARK